MPTISVYRQERFDGGVRTGIEIDGSTALQRFEEGSDEIDPALRWWIDVICAGETLPTEPEEARQWFVDNADWIKAGLAKVGEDMEAGFDAEVHPFQRPIGTAPRGVLAKVSASAIRRVEARRVAGKLRDLANEWNEVINSLSPLASV